MVARAYLSARNILWGCPMLEILPSGGAVVAFRVVGRLGGDDYDRLVAEIERRLKAHVRVAIYADLIGLRGLSFAALRKDLIYGLSKLTDLKRFGKVALVTELGLLRAWGRVAWSLVPDGDLRCFSHAEREAALAWVSQDPAQEPRGLRWIETTRPGTYAFAWTGAITNADVDTIVRKLEAEFESHISVRVLARIERMGGIQPRPLFRIALVRLKALGLRKVERYALVGGPAWLPRYASVVKQVTGIDVRHFTVEREGDAWAWLEALPHQQTARPAQEREVAELHEIRARA